MPKAIPKFSDRECRLVEQTLAERYGEAVKVDRAESELMLDPVHNKTTLCPALVWDAREAHFVISKTADNRFRCQFYYNHVEQFGTNKEEYDSLGDCVLTLLQVQSDHERERKGVRSGMNAVDFDKANDGEEYYPPIII